MDSHKPARLSDAVEDAVYVMSESTPEVIAASSTTDFKINPPETRANLPRADVKLVAGSTIEGGAPVPKT